MSQPDDSRRNRLPDGSSATGAEAASEGTPAELSLAQQLADFSRPLLEGADTAEATQNALAMGEFFWRLALAKDARSREDGLELLLKTLAQSASDRESLRALAARMIARHEQMFPGLHGPPTAGAPK